MGQLSCLILCLLPIFSDIPGTHAEEPTQPPCDVYISTSSQSPPGYVSITGSYSYEGVWASNKPRYYSTDLGLYLLFSGSIFGNGWFVTNLNWDGNWPSGGAGLFDIDLPESADGTWFVHDGTGTQSWENYATVGVDIRCVSTPIFCDVRVTLTTCSEVLAHVSDSLGVYEVVPGLHNQMPIYYNSVEDLYLYYATPTNLPSGWVLNKESIKEGWRFEGGYTFLSGDNASELSGLWNIWKGTGSNTSDYSPAELRFSCASEIEVQPCLCHLQVSGSVSVGDVVDVDGIFLYDTNTIDGDGRHKYYRTSAQNGGAAPLIMFFTVYQEDGYWVISNNEIIDYKEAFIKDQSIHPLIHTPSLQTWSFLIDETTSYKNVDLTVKCVDPDLLSDTPACDLRITSQANNPATVTISGLYELQRNQFGLSIMENGKPAYTHSTLQFYLFWEIFEAVNAEGWVISDENLPEQTWPEKGGYFQKEESSGLNMDFPQNLNNMEWKVYKVTGGRHYLNSYSPEVLSIQCEPASAPTSLPTPAQTLTPTTFPTPSTTLTPLQTLNPTSQHTPAETLSPTTLPTAGTTAVPTPPIEPAQTYSPTSTPTPIITLTPTMNPTPTQTLDPTSPPVPTLTSGPTAQPPPSTTTTPTTLPTPTQTSNPTSSPAPSRTPTPTYMPNPHTTETPTISPTPDSTMAPTTLPTPTQTSNPTHLATPYATLEPTTPPTASPTYTPTSQPTPGITLAPTTLPTPDITAVPTPPIEPAQTYSPTSVPTPSMTLTPTINPTPTQTLDPTSSPVPAQTSNPTSQPTPSTTAIPTSLPTPIQTTNPTSSPTPSRTPTPTYIPTPHTTQTPTIPPAPAPTYTPTSQPTPDITLAPTTLPTPDITDVPTPSIEPAQTYSPTFAPTHSMTLTPTINPTQTQTLDPTSSPVPVQTSDPTSQPTPRTTPIPTSLPTPIKTTNPTSSPTPSPTYMPTPHTTQTPTISPTPDSTIAPTPIQTAAPPVQTSSPTSACTYSPATFSTGTTLNSTTGYDVQHCCAWCSSEISAGCTGWNFNSATSICTLKARAGQVTSANWVSGDPVSSTPSLTIAPTATPTAATPACSTCSAKSCTNHSLNPSDSGTANICSWTPSTCNNTVDFTTAFETCESHSMRLCTKDELEANEAANAGPTCSLNNETVWSSTPCLENSEMAYYVGTGKIRDPSQTSCKNFYDTARTVCCADVDTTVGTCCQSTGRPNVLFILLDDLGYHDVGYAGNTDIVTQNIDALKNDAVEFKWYYVHTTCTPTRASLFTGRVSAELGIENVFQVIQWADDDLPYEYISEKVKNLGYSTHLIGKWHLGFTSWDQTPEGKGFDSWLGTFGAVEYHFKHNARAPPKAECSYVLPGNETEYTAVSQDGTHLWFFNETTPDHGYSVAELYDGDYSTTVYTNRALEIIQQRNATGNTDPFFILYATTAPHDPFRVPYSFYSSGACATARSYSERRGIMCGMMRSLDLSIGQITDALEATGELDNTVIIFSSDNGATAIGDTSAGSNAPLRNGKTTDFEGGTRARGFIKFPSDYNIPTGSYDGLFQIADWYLTLQSIVRFRDGLPIDPVAPFIWAQKRNGQTSSTIKTSHNHFQTIQLLQGTPTYPRKEMLYRVLWDEAIQNGTNHGAIRNEHYKLIHNANAYPKDGWFNEGASQHQYYCSYLSNEHSIRCSDRPDTLFFEISNFPYEDQGMPVGTGLDLGSLTSVQSGNYTELVNLFEEWKLVVKREILEDGLQDAQGFAELWDCSFRPWESTAANPIIIPESRQCDNPNKTITTCDSVCFQGDCWKCLPGAGPWPGYTTC